ncbi:hypothetical protein QBC34DRAFT_472993 [Podospora aff. communis PSN243]|uniref:Uncharacterized protein n=1 Tax=Podospora aff. communis PSN243 TaxID=3040156 RepID=A0AAV9GAZ4_9PEZI|nr:hypothetical protein QBC34DRAFT_472993 [Podospora aff. communis PSN243]
MDDHTIPNPSSTTTAVTLYNTWSYPRDLKDDLRDTPLPAHFIDETLTTAWEYTRCVIPTFSPPNYPRYIAFVRLIALTTIAEYHGSLIDVLSPNSDTILTYHIPTLLSTLFGHTPLLVPMSLEFRSNLLFASDKSSPRRNSTLFQRYVNLLGSSPQTWFRLRDCDGLARFTIAAALVCNDVPSDEWFTEVQLNILAEMSLTLYDAVAFYKHRAEGEVCNTFAYAGSSARVEAFHRCREVLWRLDASMATEPKMQHAVNFVRYFGGPIHLMMRRYRFVEDGLGLGGVETEGLVGDARAHVKLWNRVDVCGEGVDGGRLRVVMEREGVLFEGLREMLEDGAEGRCEGCVFREVYGAEGSGEFGGVRLCVGCERKWQEYLGSLAERAAEAFPALQA